MKDGSVQIFVRFSLDSCKQVLSNNNGEPRALFKAAGRSLKSQREVLTEQFDFGCTHMVEPTWDQGLFYKLKMIKIDMGKRARQSIIRRWSMIIRVSVLLNRSVVVDSDWPFFDNLSVCVGHLQSQSELYQVNSWYQTLGIDLIGKLIRDVIGRLSVKPWYY